MRAWVSNKKRAGFTLLEMVAVIVILAVTTVAGTEIIIALMKGRVLVHKQAEVLVNAQLTMDRMAKQLRLALPYSLAETNGGRCLRFLPVVATAFYIDEVPDSTNALPPSGRSTPISVSPYTITDGRAEFMSIGAGNNSEIYGGGARSLVRVSALSATSVTLRQNHRWQSNSAERRFFLSDEAQAFCLVGSELRYYRNVSQTSPQINLSAAYDLLAQPVAVTALNPWVRVEDAITGCQHCTAFELQFVSDDITLTKQQRVALLYAQ